MKVQIKNKNEKILQLVAKTSIKGTSIISLGQLKYEYNEGVNREEYEESFLPI